MKTMAIILVFSISSCSLLEKRKEHYSYIKQGISLEEVKTKSGSPVYESFEGDETKLVYDYCAAPYWKEAVVGVLTFTTYNWNCNMQEVKMKLHFKNGVLYKLDDNINPDEREAARRSMAEAADSFGKSMERNRGVNCTSNQIGNSTYTNCR